MLEQFIRIRRFLPAVFQTINFKSTESGQSVHDAIKFLHSIEGKKKSSINNAPKEIINESWRHLAINKEIDSIESSRIYIVCA